MNFLPFKLCASLALSVLLAACAAGGDPATATPSARQAGSPRVLIPIVNPSFDANAQGQLDGWEGLEHGRGGSYTFLPDSHSPHSPPSSARIRRHGVEEYGWLNQDIRVRPEWRGKAVRLSGFLRTEGAVGAGGSLILQVLDGGGGVLVWDHMTDRKIRGTQAWKRYTAQIAIPSQAYVVRVGAMLEEAGTMWVDDLALELLD